MKAPFVQKDGHRRVWSGRRESQETNSTGAVLDCFPARGGRPAAPDLLYTLAVDVSGCIECIANDWLPQVVEALQRAADVSTEQLEQDFLERKRRA
jgi:hypothetical protein